MNVNPTLFDVANDDAKRMVRPTYPQDFLQELVGVEKAFQPDIDTEWISQLNDQKGYCLKENPKDAFPDAVEVLVDLNAYVRYENDTRFAFFDMQLFRHDLARCVRLADNAIAVLLKHIARAVDAVKNSADSAEEKKKRRKLWLKLKSRLVHDRLVELHLLNEKQMLESLNMPAYSAYAQAFTQELHKHFLLAAYAQTIELAKERGTFPEFRSVSELKNPVTLLLHQLDPLLYEKMVLYGRRNNLKLNF